MTYICPYFDQERKKCMLWGDNGTYQSDYNIKEHCMGPYWDSYKRCANYETKKREGVVP